MAKLRMIKVKMLEGGQCNPTQVAGQEPVKYEEGDVIEVAEHLLEGMSHICVLFEGDDQEAEELKPKEPETLQAPVIEEPVKDVAEEFVLETALKPALQEKAAELGIDPNQTVALLRNAIDEALNPKPVKPTKDELLKMIEEKGLEIQNADQLSYDELDHEICVAINGPAESEEEVPEGAIDLASLDSVQMLALVEEHEIDVEITADMDEDALRDAIATAVAGPEEKSDDSVVEETKPEVNPAPENKSAK